MDEAKQMTAEHIEALASVAQSALDAWDSLGRPGRVRPPGYAEADAIVRLVAEVRRLTAALDVVRGDLGDTNAIADGYIARLRAEHAAALATARREGAEAMRAKCLGRLEEMLDELHENGAGRDAAAQALTDAHEYMRSSLCRIDDAPGGAT